MNDDLNLLREFARNNSEDAFAALVSRHINLVYSVALRQTRDAHLAEEITQAVFIILARKADSLGDKIILSGWLCRTARYASANALKIQMRRQKREQEVFMQNVLNETANESAPDETWNEISPLLDGAMEQLGQKDHDALVLRFFENKTFAEVGETLGASEDAAKMRVNRALEKLRKFFTKRGVSSTTAIIAGTISANSVQAAPVVLAKSVAAVAIAKGAAASGSTLTLIKGALKLMMWAKAKTVVVVTVSTLLIAGVGVETARWLQEQKKGSQQPPQLVQEQQPQTSSIKTAQTENIIVPNAITNTADLSSAQILKKAQETYASLSSYSDTGKIISETVDYTLTNSFSIRLARPNLYRIEWENGICWSLDDANYIHMNGMPVREESNPRDAISQSSVLAVPAAFLGKIYSEINWGDNLAFFVSSPSVVRLADEKIQSDECYVFNIKGEPTIYLWIGKTDFLIHQIKTFGKNAAAKEFTFIETHENIATNQPFTEDDFLEQAQ
jgi:RNA polymerase sigma factor (sigma-70 family)